MDDFSLPDGVRILPGGTPFPRSDNASLLMEAKLVFMKPSPMDEALDELRWFLHSDHTPPWIKTACSRLSERQKELFVWVPEVDGATGTPRTLAGLHPSDFLCELLTAFRASDWPQVTILVHRNSPSRASSEVEE